MDSKIIFAILALFVAIASAAGPAQTEDEVTQHHAHGPSDEQKAKLRQKQSEFIQRSQQIKNDETMTEEEKQAELHKLREHAMFFMGPHAMLPHALLQESPIPEVEAKRLALIKAVERVAHSGLELEEKKAQLEQLRDRFKVDVSEIHRNLPQSEVSKVRSSIKKKTQADAYKKMIHDGIRGVGAAGARSEAFNKAIYEGVQKVTAGMKNKEKGAFRKDMTAHRMAASGKKGQKRRAVKQSLSRPDA